MISQNCPKCKSKRIRRGYRQTPLWSKILFRFNLLCDGCNWEFMGFAVPGTISAKPTKKRKTYEKTGNGFPEIGNAAFDENKPRRATSNNSSGRVKVRL